MTMLLHIDSAAHRSPESVTRSLGAAFTQAWRAAHPEGRYLRHDLEADPVPPIDSAYCALGRRLERLGALGTDDVEACAVGEQEVTAWRRTRPWVTELLEADVVLIAAPMYNFGVPAALKAWIDRVTFPGVLNPPGRESPLASTRFVLLTASGGCYGPGTPRDGMDFLTPHLRAWLIAYGATPERIEEVRVEATLAPLVDRLASLRPLASRSRADAERRLRVLAGRAGTAALTEAGTA